MNLDAQSELYRRLPVNAIVSAEQILHSAKIFKRSIKGTRKADYHDYERYKCMLHDNGHYGHEKELADILEV